MLDFIFGRTKTRPTSTVRTVSKLPEEIAPYVKEVLKEAQTQYAQDKEEPYLPYEGETIAPRDQLELDAIERQKGLVGIQDAYRDEAEEIIRSLPTEFAAETAEKFMSPYQQAVVEVQKRKAQEDFEQRIMPEFEKQAIEAGGLSGLGSRAGVQAALLGQGQAQLLSDIQAVGQQKAYEDALRQFTLAGELGRRKASDLERIGLDRFNIGLAESGLLQSLGQAEREESQRLLDKEFSDYIEEKEFPKQALAQYSSFVYGNPFLREPDTTVTTTGRGRPSIGNQLFSAGLSGLNLYGRGTKGFTQPFSFATAFSKEGGRLNKGLRSLPVVNRQAGGGIAMGIDPYLTPGSMSAQARELESAGETNLESGAIPKTILGITALNKAKQDKIRATNAAIDASARAAKAEQNIAMRDNLERQLIQKLKVKEPEDKPFEETFGGKFIQNLSLSLVNPETQERGLSVNAVNALADAEKEVREEAKEKEKRDIAKLKAGVEIAQKQVDRPGQQRTAQLQQKKLIATINKLEKEAGGKRVNFTKADRTNLDTYIQEDLSKSFLNSLVTSEGEPTRRAERVAKILGAKSVEGIENAMEKLLGNSTFRREVITEIQDLARSTNEPFERYAEAALAKVISKYKIDPGTFTDSVELKKPKSK